MNCRSFTSDDPPVMSWGSRPAAWATEGCGLVLILDPKTSGALRAEDQYACIEGSLSGGVPAYARPSELWPSLLMKAAVREEAGFLFAELG